MTKRASRHARPSRTPRGRWFLLAPLLALGIVASGLIGAVPAVAPVAKASDALGVVNPMRGQFDNIGTGLFPQSNVAQQDLPDWPGTNDAGLRVNWRSLQPVDPSTLPPGAPDSAKYDFSAIDDALASYAERGVRVGLRVSSYDSCCEVAPAGGVNIGVPDWLAARPDAVGTYSANGIEQVVPNWNDSDYLDGFVDLLGALGRRYDRDERLSIFEMSGYGDFSENHVSTLRDQMGAPGPDEQSSEAQLGYYSQYRDQVITKDNVVRLVDANLRAFRNTQMVTSVQNPEIVKQLLRDSAELAETTKPVGLRADCLGVYSPLPTWAQDEYSEYVERDDPIIDTLVERYSGAPVLTEWCQKPDEMSASDYYETGLSDVIDHHVSMTASSGFPDQFAESTMDPQSYALWSEANTVAGYRYSVSMTAQQPDSDGLVRAQAAWTNIGSAPTHEQWAVEYRLVDRSGTVVDTVPATVDLESMTSPQSYAANGSTPTPTIAEDSVEFDSAGLAAGTYTIAAVVQWDEHKVDASTRVDYAPMNLAQNGRLVDGSYALASIDLP